MRHCFSQCTTIRILQNTTLDVMKIHRTKGVTALANALQSKHCNINALDLRWNDIGPNGVTALATALQSKHCKITTLDLSGNNIGPNGCHCFSQCTTIKALHISLHLIFGGMT